ncbi:CBU_0592 family membrane protein [Roseobacter sp. CCS2]|uniref:CBU_0592 family membrane protein n=1 Tax=Roseobacter sp. CCS2 TaxID=391593 RepID=UPI0000F4007B|nr:hypothetical protein [Roseobacter sp. CCS2]EBA13036.1 hypothetical protein RCCS2_04104 [Roseobacter sp. CCS2]
MVDLTDKTLFDAFGVAGFGLYVLNYTMLTLQRVKSDSIRYFAVNLAAAALVLIGLTTAFNLASALIQIFFIFSSGVAILIRLRARHQTKAQLQY